MNAENLTEEQKKALATLLFAKDSPEAKECLVPALAEADRRFVIPVMYDEKMNSDPGGDHIAKISPSAKKPKELFERLCAINDDPKGRFGVLWIAYDPLTREDFKLAHNPDYIDGIMSLKLPNGFKTRSQSVVNSLPYTTGAMYAAAKFAFETVPSCALVSGFHHAGYHGHEGLGYFCTLNGLMIAAVKLLNENPGNRVAIVDGDYHEGNGTQDVIDHLRARNARIPGRATTPRLTERIYHKSFGRIFTNKYHAQAYLDHFKYVGEDLEAFKPTHILYQAGADAHIDDPCVLDRELGGVLTDDQMYERDLRMFALARDMKVPLAWNLAGGYQVDEKGSAKKVIDLHVNTFNAAADAYWKYQD